MLRPVARLIEGPRFSPDGCLFQFCNTSTKQFAKVAKKADTMHRGAMVSDRASSPALQHLLERSRYYASHYKAEGLSESEAEEICQLAGVHFGMATWLHRV
jgi:hypothetical protein